MLFRLESFSDHISLLGSTLIYRDKELALKQIYKHLENNKHNFIIDLYDCYVVSTMIFKDSENFMFADGIGFVSPTHPKEPTRFARLFLQWANKTPLVMSVDSAPNIYPIDRPILTMGFQSYCIAQAELWYRRALSKPRLQSDHEHWAAKTWYDLGGVKHTPLTNKPTNIA